MLRVFDDNLSVDWALCLQGEMTGSVEVEIGHEMLLIELIDMSCLISGYMPVSEFPTNDRSIFAFYETIICAFPRSTLGLVDVKFFQKICHNTVDVFRSIIRVEIMEYKGKYLKSHIKNWLEIFLTNSLYSHDYLPLCDFIDKIDVIDAFGDLSCHLIDQISLMHRIHTDEPWNTIGSWFRTCTNSYRRTRALCL